MRSHLPWEAVSTRARLCVLPLQPNVGYALTRGGRDRWLGAQFRQVAPGRAPSLAASSLSLLRGRDLSWLAAGRPPRAWIRLGERGTCFICFQQPPLYVYTAYTQSLAPGEKSSDFTPTSPPPRRVLSSHRSEVQPFRVPLCLRLERDPVLNSLRAAESSSTSCSTSSGIRVALLRSLAAHLPSPAPRSLPTFDEKQSLQRPVPGLALFWPAA